MRTVFRNRKDGAFSIVVGGTSPEPLLPALSLIDADLAGIVIASRTTLNSSSLCRIQICKTIPPENRDWLFRRTRTRETSVSLSLDEALAAPPTSHRQVPSEKWQESRPNCPSQGHHRTGATLTSISIGTKTTQRFHL